MSPRHALGLGLAVSRDVVAALDGEITIDSIAGRGTTVRIAMPASTDTVEAACVAVPQPAIAATTARRRILIIDDDRPVAAAIALELGAHDVVVAESGRSARGVVDPAYLCVGRHRREDSADACRAV